MVELLQFQLDREEEVVSARLLIAGVVIQQKFVVRETDDGAALRHQARVFGVEAHVVRGLRLVDGYNIDRDGEAEFVQHVGYLR